MKIICTAPNGATFEAAANVWAPQNNTYSAQALCEEHNRRERASLQEALATWCGAMGAKPEDAKVAA